jgi:hypothetical protein
MNDPAGVAQTADDGLASVPGAGPADRARLEAVLARLEGVRRQAERAEREARASLAVAKKAADLIREAGPEDPSPAEGAPA